MHVHAATTLSAETIKARFNQIGLAGSASTTPLRYAGERQPPKFFLPGMPVTPPAAAEVSITEKSGGADVVLRLMWGSFPAPFPRALAGIGLVLGLLILVFSDHTVSSWLLAAIFIVAPVTALFCQRQGERVLQSSLSNMLDGAVFRPISH
ncbi:MAG TPA: hypothetical protein DEA71_10875 [Nitrospira sp.]|nr:hypothetical protein [Nitrospira sp.]